MYVADTHAWVYYLLGKLPKSLQPIFRKAENLDEVVFIPTIVLNEIIWLVNKGSVSLDAPKMLSKLEDATNFVVVPLDLDTTKKVAEIKIGELHDRIIVATAKMFDATLITKDREIVESGIVKTLW